MTITPPELGRLPRNSFLQSRWSPTPPPGVEAIVLRGAERIELGDAPFFPIAGSYQVRAAFFNRFPCLPAEIVMVAVREDTHVALAANLHRPNFVAIPGHIDPASPSFESLLTGGFFNLDLYHFLPALSREPGRVHVYATVGELVSNTVTVELA